MKRINHRKFGIAILSAGLFAASVALAEDAWINSDNVQIRAGKGAIYPVVATPKKGDKLDVTAHEGKWLKVKVSDTQDGYVYVDSISPEKVAGGGNALADLGGGADTTKMGTASAGKGLTPDATAYATGKNLDPKLLDKVIADNKKIDPKEWEAFQAEGKVGNDAP